MHPSRQEYCLQELQRLSEKQGLPNTLKPKFFPINAAPTSYAVIAAQAVSSGDVGGLAQSLLRACWFQEKDIAQDDVIKEGPNRAGFDPALVDSGLLSGAETYAANLEKAVALGVLGSPFYIVDNEERFWGQDRLDDLDFYLAGEL